MNYINLDFFDTISPLQIYAMYQLLLVKTDKNLLVFIFSKKPHLDSLAQFASMITNFLKPAVSNSPIKSFPLLSNIRKEEEKSIKM